MKYLFALCLLLVSLLPGGAHADCRPKQMSVESFENASRLGISLVQTLERLNPKVAIVGRAGTDLTKYGLRYSHAGLVFRDHPKGRWMFTHLLVRCGEKYSNLYDEGPITFFSDNPHKYEAILAIPNPSLQQELERLLLAGKARNLHEQRYNVIANPDQPIFQNSNQWVLEMIAVAKSIHLPPDQRKNAVTLATEYGYQPDEFKIGFFKRAFAPLVNPHIHFQDQGDEAIKQGKFRVVTVRSIFDFLKRNKDIDRIVELVEAAEVRVTYELDSRKPRVVRSQPTKRTIQNIPTEKNTAASIFWGA